MNKGQMGKITSGVVRFRYVIFGIFAGLLILSLALLPRVKANFDITKYLPKDMETRAALSVIKDEFGEFSSVNVMLEGVTREEASGFARKLQVKYVSMVGFSEASGYKDGSALIKLTLDGGDYSDEAQYVVKEVGSILSSAGITYYMDGSAVNGTNLQNGIAGEMTIIMVIALVIVLGILLATSRSWFEPVIFLIVIGVSILINLGTNFFLGEISYITKSIAAILQLALAMDYSIVLLHAYDKHILGGETAHEAAANALADSFKPIISSSLTTIAGLVALMFMSFKIGLDIGLVMSKGIVISMLTVYFLMPGLVVVFARPLKKLRHKPLPLGGKILAKGVIKARFVLPIILVGLIATGAVLQSFNTYSFTETQSNNANAIIKQTFGNESSMILLVPKAQNEQDYLRQDALIQNISALKIGDKTPLKSATTFAGAIKAAGGEGAPSIVREKLDTTFNGEKHSRIIVSFDFGGKIGGDTYAYIDSMKAELNKLYGADNFIAGDVMSNYDIAKSFNSDLIVTNLITIIAILLIIGVTFRSISIPAILVLVIQGAIWVAMSFSFMAGSPIFFMSYLISSAILMGATIDYGILVTNNYIIARKTLNKRDAVAAALDGAMPTILTSGLILTIAGFIVGAISSSCAVSTIGFLLGRGTLVSLILIIALLPALLFLLDKFISKTTKACKNFHP